MSSANFSSIASIALMTILKLVDPARKVAYLVLNVAAMLLAVLLMTILLTSAVSYVIDYKLDTSPLHTAIAVDFTMIIIGAALAELAQGPSQVHISSLQDLRSRALAGFSISAGTLAPLACHVAEVWQGPFEGTIISSFLCHWDSLRCHHRYAYTILLLAIACLLTALVAALALGRTSASDGTMLPNYRTRSLRRTASFTIVASAVLLCVYTMFVHRWKGANVAIQLPEGANLLFLAGLLFSIPLMFGFLAPASAKRVKRTVREVQDSLRPAKGQRPAQNIAHLVSMSVVPALIWVILLGLGLFFLELAGGHLSRLFLEKELAEQIVRSFRIPLHLSLTAACAILAVSTIALLQLRFRGGENIEYDVDLEEEQENGDPSIVPSRPQTASIFMRALQAFIRCIGSAWQHNIAWHRRVARHICRLTRKILLWLPTHKNDDKAGWITAASLISFSALSLIYLTWPPKPQDGALGKAFKGVEFLSGKAGFPFSRASLGCSAHIPLAWSHSAADELYLPHYSCRLRNLALPCRPVTIVAVGTASAAGSAYAEARRSLLRGRQLAAVLAQDYRRQCGDSVQVDSYILNLGPYRRGALDDDAVGQREVIVLLGEGVGSDPEVVAVALQGYLAEDVRLGYHSLCELHRINSSGERSLLRSLNCAP
jgi:hypothetical protein